MSWAFVLSVMLLVATCSCASSERRTSDQLPSRPPLSFDCNLRRVAHGHAQRILHTAEALRSVRTALQLDHFCGETSPDPPPLGPPFAHAYAVASESARTFWVDTAGSDSTGDGSVQRPFATPHRARDALREAGALGGTIFLNPGTYYLASPLELNEDDRNVTVTAAPGSDAGAVVVSGGRLLRDLDWKPAPAVRHPNAIVAVVPNLTYPAIFVNGIRHWPGRYPNGNPDWGPDFVNHTFPAADPGNRSLLIPLGWTPVGKGTSALKPNPTGVNTSIQWLNLTRNFTSTGTRNGSFHWTVGGPTNERFDPPESYWGAATASGIVVDPTHAERWLVGLSPVTDARVYTNSWPKTWGGTWVFEAASVDAQGTVLFGRGGHQEARGGPASKIAIWYIENLLVEVDTPGEFYFDERNNTLFLVPNVTGSPDSFELVVPQLTNLISIRNTSGVVVSGLTFRHAAPTQMNKYESLPSGDW